MILRLLLTGILAAGFAFAQRGGGGMGGDEGGMGGGGRGGSSLDVPNISHTPSRMDIISGFLKLDKNQKKNLKTVFDAAQKQATPIHEQIVKSRLAIGDAIQGGKSQDEVKSLLANEASLESQLTRIELDAFASVYKSLEQEQRAQTRNLFVMMKGMFDGKNWNNVE
jgi:hypothetical protein